MGNDGQNKEPKRIKEEALKVSMSWHVLHFLNHLLKECSKYFKHLWWSFLTKFASC